MPSSPLLPPGSDREPPGGAARAAAPVPANVQAVTAPLPAASPPSSMSGRAHARTPPDTPTARDEAWIVIGRLEELVHQVLAAGETRLRADEQRTDEILREVQAVRAQADETRLAGTRPRQDTLSEIEGAPAGVPEHPLSASIRAIELKQKKTSRRDLWLNLLIAGIVTVGELLHWLSH